MKKILCKIYFLALVFSITSCVAEYDLLEEIDYTNSNVIDTPTSGCNPRKNTVYQNGSRIVYDDIFYSTIWSSSLNVLSTGKVLKGQDNNIGSKLYMEFNKDLTEGEYTVQDHDIAGSITDHEVVMYGNYTINGTKIRHYAEPGTKLTVKLTSNGKWSASFCDSKFTVDWTAWSNNFTTDGNLIQTYP